MSILYFILAISLLVSIHEFGHFWVARRLGVKVLRFSVGFGKPLFCYTDKQGIEYTLAPIPLGGYVKMLDEREAPVAQELKPQAFNNKPPWVRIAIAAAGPAANFIFAIIAYWFLAVGTQQTLIPVIGEVKPDTPAHQGGLQVGDEIIAIDHKPVTDWQAISWELIARVGESGKLNIEVIDSDKQHQMRTLTLNNWLADDDISPFSALGIRPRQLEIAPIIDKVQAGSAAEKAGLQSKDRIVQVDGQPIASWQQWVTRVQSSANKTLNVQFVRHNESLSTLFTPEAKTDKNGQTVGFAGILVALPEYPQSWLRSTQVGLWQGLFLGVQKTWQTSLFTLESLGKMLSGQLSIKNLSGPISIAKVAGDTAGLGVVAFISFLALLSVSLGVLNLLPIPVLDGGHILFALYEWVWRKPLPERVQHGALTLGVMLLVCMMFLAFYNDIYRLMGS